MMDPSFAINGDDEHLEHRSSSLPSPEEARMNMDMESGSSRRNSLGTDDIAKQGMDHTESNHDSFGNHSNRESFNDGSQLPTPEDLKVATSPRRSSSSMSNMPNRKKRAVFVALALTLIVIVVCVAVAVTVTQKDGNKSDGGKKQQAEFWSYPVESDGDEGATTTLQLDTPAPVVPGPPPSIHRVTSDPPTPNPTQATVPVPAGTPTKSPTAVPTRMPVSDVPTMSRYNYLWHLLFELAVSSSEDLGKVGTPQQRALNWIANADAMQVPVSDVERIVQRYVLAVLYYSMGGNKWRNNLNFLSKKSECDWYYNLYRSQQKQFGATCNAEGKVKSLEFPTKFLTGSFPKELSLLKDLERFNVFNNKGLAGQPFPEFLKELPKLSFIGLHYCDFIGPLPSWLGEITALKSLVLSNNEFQGVLPESMAKLTNLEDLYLDDNQFQGNIGMLKSMAKMKNLVLEDNQFTGSFDDAMVSNWAQLETIDASHNRLGGTIPDSMAHIPNIRIVDLHENEFSGPIPQFSEANPALEMLTLNNNAFNGEIPNTLGACSNLRHVDLTNNKLSSTIPASLGNLLNLEIFYLAKNSFDPSPIPTSFKNLKSLKQLSLKSTNLKGPLPSWMGDLSGLTMLDLDSNKLSGAIPTSLGGLTDLEYLLINRNELEGEIPTELKSLSNLRFFVADKNKLSGSAEAVCQAVADPNDLFAASDCRGTTPEVECSCCNVCCADGDSTCNDDAWLADSNPMWELEYSRAVTVEFDAAPSRVYVVKFTGDIP